MSASKLYAEGSSSLEIDTSGSSSSSYSNSYGSTSSDTTPPISPRIFSASSNEPSPPISPRIMHINTTPTPSSNEVVPPPVSPRIVPIIPIHSNEGGVTPPPVSPRVHPLSIPTSSSANEVVPPPVSPRIFQHSGSETSLPISLTPRTHNEGGVTPPPISPRVIPTSIDTTTTTTSPRLFSSNSSENTNNAPPPSPRGFAYGFNASSSNSNMDQYNNNETRSESSHSVSSTSSLTSSYSTSSNSSNSGYEYGTLSRNNSISTSGASALNSSNKRRTKILYAPRVVKPFKTLSTSTLLIADTSKENVNLMYSERETDTLKELFTLLVTNQTDVIKEFFKFQLINVDELCETLISMSFATSTPMQLIKYFIEDDFKSNRNDINNILNENSLASKLIKIYLNRVGINYLMDLLGDIINQIVVNDRKVSYEINPTFLEPDELEKNKKTLQKRINSIFDCIISKESVDKMPTGIRVIGGTIAECARQYCSNSNYPFVGNFFILRYFSPALFSPEQHGLLAKGKIISSETRRNLLLITKIIQNAVDGIEFNKKEDFMRLLQDFIDSKKSLLTSYYQNIIIPATTTVPIPADLNVISMKDLHGIHQLLQQRDQLMSLISPTIIQEFTKLLDKLGTYQHKNSFSFLNATDRKAVKTLLEEKHEEVGYLMWVDKKKRNKVQKRLIVVGLNRIFSLKPGGKVAREGHMLDLVEVKSNDPKELEIMFKTFTITCSSTNDSMDDMISSIRRAYFYTFSNLPEELYFKLNVPSNRLIDIPPADLSSCGNLIPIYRSLCDYYHTPVHEDLCWDAENLFERENLKSLNLTKFAEQYEEPLQQLELLPIFHALRYNTYFTSLIIKNFKLEKQAFLSLTELLKVNTTLHSLTFSNINGPKELYLTLFDSLLFNSYCSIISLDLSNTLFEEKHLLTLAIFLKKSSKRIIYLDFSNIGITSKGMSSICSSLVENKQIELEHLSLSNNKLSSEGSASLGQYLSSEGNVGSLRYLYLSGSNIVFKPILEALIAGKSPLKTIDFSNNKITKEETSILSDYLSQNSFLEELNLSNTQLISESLEKLILSFNQDVYITLDISNNAFGLTGAKIISKIAYKLNNIYTLDLSDTDIGDDGMAELLHGFKNNYNIKRLYLNRNFKGSKTKGRTTAVNNLIKMISSDCTIEALHISAKSHPLKNDLLPFIFALGENTSLTELDISGHQMGNTGAIALAKSLQTNNSLIKLLWDENQTGILG